MTTLILKWPDNATAVACGTAMGTTSEDETGENITATLVNGLNVDVIGAHSYISDNSDPEEPITTTVSGWWAMVWLADASIISSLMGQLPEALRPEIVWRSDAVDDEGELISRPPINLCPQRVVA